ncbi:MAG: hypothetical protein O2955_13865 [Planctomycetota bacterium]|nr:hypothetical protein [Planctomycetota bacterium]MDA1213597.1 hypothetical protein [Planctomycetota bacterium]
MSNSRTSMRRRNDNEPGHAHELTFSCYHRLPLLSRERSCRWLADVASLWKWSSAGWFEDCGGNDLKPDPIPTEWLM